MRRTVGNLVASLALGLCLFLVNPPGVFSQEALDLNDPTASTVGQTVTFTVSINSAPTALQAYGFTINYDSNILQFASFTRGPLVENAFFEVNTEMAGSLPTGGITIAGSEDTGFSLEPIPQGTSGILVQLNFTVLSLTATTLTITNPVDDLAQQVWTLGNGLLTIVPPGNVDIDGNGASDALTDGLLILRFLFEFRGNTLINGVVAGNCTRCTAEAIEAFLNDIS